MTGVHGCSAVDGGSPTFPLVDRVVDISAAHSALAVARHEEHVTSVQRDALSLPQASGAGGPAHQAGPPPLATVLGQHECWVSAQITPLPRKSFWEKGGINTGKQNKMKWNKMERARFSTSHPLPLVLWASDLCWRWADSK